MAKASTRRLLNCEDRFTIDRRFLTIEASYLARLLWERLFRHVRAEHFVSLGSFLCDLKLFEREFEARIHTSNVQPFYWEFRYSGWTEVTNHDPKSHNVYRIELKQDEIVVQRYDYYMPPEEEKVPEIDTASAPTVHYEWGDIQGNLGVSIDRWDDHHFSEKYQARIWVNGDTADMNYYATFNEAMNWLKEQLVPIYIADHDLTEMPPSALSDLVIGLAPGRASMDDDWEWSPILAGDEQTWWTGSDYEVEATRPVRIHLFPDTEPKG